jgi:acetyltransferase-like isoleucine patch superfamily enzyme
MNTLNLKGMAKIHINSDVQTKSIGEGTVIWQFVVILPGSVIGENCNINSHCFIENDVIIGNSVTVKCGVFIWDGTRIEDEVFIGPGVTFINNNHPRSKKYPEKHIGAYIEKGASIGANSTIMGGIRIGRYAMIGAGSVVTKNVPNNSLWIGNPARQVGFICDCGYKLNDKLHCKECKSDYHFVNNILVRQ